MQQLSVNVVPMEAADRRNGQSVSGTSGLPALFPTQKRERNGLFVCSRPVRLSGVYGYEWRNERLEPFPASAGIPVFFVRPG